VTDRTLEELLAVVARSLGGLSARVVDAGAICSLVSCEANYSTAFEGRPCGDQPIAFRQLCCRL